MYGAEPGKASFANNCLLARRLVERGVRFVQLYHTDWDHHAGPRPARSIRSAGRWISPRAALIQDLKQRGLLDDTLVIWGGEFGRTPMGEVRDNGKSAAIITSTLTPCCMAGGGIEPARRRGRPTNWASPRRKTSISRPRPAGHHAAPAGPRPHQADLPLPGP